jgi:hypothetical protein
MADIDFIPRLKREDPIEYAKRCLMYVSPEDINFRSALEGASLGLLEQVLAVIPAANNKTRRQVIERRIRRLQKQGGG